MRILPKPEREYIFSFDEREFPVYLYEKRDEEGGLDLIRVGNCKKINVCAVEKREIHSYNNPSKKSRKIISLIEDRLTNGLFLQINPSEECIALNPWYVISDSKKLENRYYIIPHYNSTRKENYFFIPEFELLGLGSSKHPEAVVLKFDVKKIEDLSKYHSFSMKGYKNDMLW